MAWPIKTIDVDLVASFLSYNKETGDLFWKNRPHAHSKQKAGDKAGTTLNDGYVMVRIKRRGYLAHRLAWAIATGSSPEMDIDHINGIKSDNRISNLRLATHQQNQQNKYFATSKNKTSKLLGVGYYKRTNKFRADITANGKRMHLGSFDSKEDAQAAYLAAKKIHHISQSNEFESLGIAA